MPRNGSGDYTLAGPNPVVGGTTIEPSWANPTLADVAEALTNSLARDGAGGMTAALKLINGTVGLPALTFTSEVTSGWYRAGTSDFRYSIQGSDVLRLFDDSGSPAGEQRPLEVWDGDGFFPVNPFDPDNLVITGSITLDDGGGVTGIWNAANGQIVSGTITKANLLAPTVVVPNSAALVNVTTPQPASVSGSTTLDFGESGSWRLTLTADITLNAPTNPIPGRTYSVEVQGNSATVRTLTFGPEFMNQTNIGTNDTEPYLLTIFCRDATHFYVGVLEGDLS